MILKSDENLHLFRHRFHQDIIRRAVWHLGEAFVMIGGKLVYLWRAVDDEDTVLDVVVQTRRNRKAALRLITKLLKNQTTKKPMCET